MVKKKFSILVLSIILTVVALSTLGAMVITVIAPTENPLITSNDTVNLSYGIDASDGLSSITHSWNGTNTTLWDYQLVLHMNFDNRSELGENDTFVRDLSMYGNNGTVVGGENITWSNTGKYDGAFNFSGKSPNYINVSNFNKANTSNVTISFWAKPSKNITALAGVFSSTGTHYYVGFKDNDRMVINYNWQNGTSTTVQTENYVVKSNEWHFYSYAIGESSNGVNITFYKDGVYISSFLDNNGWKDTYLKHYIIGSYSAGFNSFNGSLDDLTIFNKTLTSSQINMLYRSQITKFNESYFEYNITLNNNISSQKHFLCSANSTNDAFCSTESSVVMLSKVNTNYSTSIGIIRSDFYGTNVHGYWGFDSTLVNIGSSGTYLNTSSNFIWHRNNILNSGIKYIRADMDLHFISTAEGVLKDVGNYSYQWDSDMNTKRSLVSWAKLNNIKIIFVAGSMPSWLADETSGYCVGPAYSSCNPSNYTKWGELVVDFLQEAGCDSNTCEVSVWNEPDFKSSWLNNINTSSNGTRSVEYNKLYNATYLAVKSEYPNMAVGGASTTANPAADSTQVILKGFLSNFSNQMDFLEYHQYKYDGTGNYDFVLNKTYFNLLANCTTYSANCSRIVISEFNVANSSMQNTSSLSNQYTTQLGLVYYETLNTYPENVSLIQYQWSSRFKYGNPDAPESIYLWSMVSEPQLDNAYYPPYNVTKNFAHLCPAGATVYVTSGDDSAIKQVSCKKGNQYSLIVINTGTDAKNITLNMSMTNGTVKFPYSNLVNYEDDTTTYKVNDGVAQLGVIDSYEILYLYSGVEDGALLRGVFKLNEGSGNTIYDSLQNLSNGLKSGATWITDGILNTLSTAQYTIDLVTGLLILDTDYLYEYLHIDYNYNKVFGFHVSILNVIAGFLMIIVLGVGIIYVVKYFKNIKEYE